MEGRILKLSDIEEHVRTIVEDADLTIVEAAGGLMVPIQGRLMMIDLIQRLGYPTLLVARTRLGTLNHTLLSLEALERRDIRTVGIVLSCTEPNPGLEEEFTPGDLAKLVKDIPVIVLPHLDTETAKNPKKIANKISASWPPDFVAKCLGKQD